MAGTVLMFFSFLGLFFLIRGNPSVVPTDPPVTSAAAANSRPTIHLANSGKYIMCFIEDFYPKALKIKWKKDDGEVRGRDWKTTESDWGSYRAVSVLKKDLASSSPGTRYTCEVTHGGQTYSEHITSEAHFSVKVSPPQAKELFKSSRAVIKCVIRGDNLKQVDRATVSWTVGGNTTTSGITHGAVKQTGSSFTKTSTLTLIESVWFEGKEVECSTSSDQKISDKIKIKKGGVDPSITIYKPDRSVSDTETEVSLVCEVSSSDLGDVYIMWRVDDGEFEESSSTTTVKNKGKTSAVLSSFTVTGKEYNRATIECAVKHANMENYNQPRASSMSNAHFSLKINPPQTTDLFINSRAVIECVISGDKQKQVEGARVSWRVGGKVHTSGITHGAVKQTGSSFTKTSILTLTESDWFRGKEVECSTSSHQNNISDKITIKKGTDPSIIIYKPDRSVSDIETEVSLVCEVSSSDLGDVYIMWQVGDGQYMEGSSTTTITNKGKTSAVLSSFTVTGKEYNTAVILCVVKDANMKNNNQPRKKSLMYTKVSCPSCPVCEY